jgi:hypothetical protein
MSAGWAACKAHQGPWLFGLVGGGLYGVLGKTVSARALRFGVDGVEMASDGVKAISTLFLAFAWHRSGARELRRVPPDPSWTCRHMSIWTSGHLDIWTYEHTYGHPDIHHEIEIWFDLGSMIHQSVTVYCLLFTICCYGYGTVLFNVDGPASVRVLASEALDRRGRTRMGLESTALSWLHTSCFSSLRAGQSGHAYPFCSRYQRRDRGRLSLFEFLQSFKASINESMNQSMNE